MHHKTRALERLLSASMVGAVTSVRIAFAAGGIATDGTVGPAQTLSGTNVTIPQTLGSTVGKNLFHSFSQFNVNTGQTVTFTENNTNTLDNVVSRVTGGSSSDINGTLQSTPGGHANFYLINPAGVVFGQGAQVNVPGAFHVSTADELRFKDGSKYSATHPETSTLTSAAPASFGFLGTSAANNGLLKVDGAQLQTKSGQTMDMVGGKITVENGAKLSAPSGDIRLVARQGAGDVSVEPNSQGNLPLPPDIPSAANAGTINVQDSTLEAKGNGGGRVAVWGGNVTVKAGGKIDTSPLFVGAAGAITVRASTLTIDGQNQPGGTTGINAGAFFGDGGTVELTSAGATSISDGASIDASSTIGNGGTVQLTSAGAMSISNGAIISTSTFLASGNAGTVKLHAGSLIIDGQGKKTGIGSIPSPGGHAGAIEVDVDGDMSITNGATITTSTLGAGPAGFVDVTANGTMDISNGAVISSSQNSKFGTGHGGTVNLTSKGAMHVSSGAVVATDTIGSGDAGAVNVHAGSLTIDGHAGISSSSDGVGNAGTVDVTVDRAIQMTNFAGIFSFAFGAGSGGLVKVEASVLNLGDFAFISAG
ncbi:MAG TPA: filamentous hemagglutinin N-terminal domain-containing protein, partial [Aggregatilineaceae bacterium]|nr:filamentous hemagglutinin N-terminal domain-containing protein [Aggregatilineaceae bacterium]